MEINAIRDKNPSSTTMWSPFSPEEKATTNAIQPKYHPNQQEQVEKGLLHA
jgi:hypothetical protein